jgi:PIN domain nuclease of toxin-antitoxin system
MRQYYVIDTTSLISYYPEIFKQEVKIKQEYLELIKHAFFPSSPIRIIVPSIVFIEIFEKWSVNEENSRCIYSEIFSPINEAPNFEIAPLESEVLEKFISINDDIVNLENHDKIIVATALMHECPIISDDPKIRSYMTKESKYKVLC